MIGNPPAEGECPSYGWYGAHRRDKDLMNNPGPLRVLFLANDDNFFFTHRLPIAKAVLEKGAITAVAAPDGPMRRQIEQAGFLFLPVRFFRRNLNPLRELLTLSDVRRAYGVFRPDLVHQTTFKPIVIGSWVARRQKIPAIVNQITGLGYVYSGEGLSRRLLRKVAEWGYGNVLGALNSRVIFQNSDDRNQFVDKRLVVPERSLVIPGSGVDEEVFRPSGEPAPPVRILLPSRMLWDKGVGDAVAACHLLHAKGLDFRLVLSGAPDPQNPASIDEETLVAWNAEPFIEWIGFQHDMPALIAQSHIVCLPSFYREGIPKALIEAASCGRPLVSTDMPGCREIVRDGHNGLLAPPRDPARLAEALGKLIGDAELRKTMGRNGREMVLRRFSTQQIIAQTMQVYEELLETTKVEKAF